MKITAVITSRNDNWGINLKQRAILCLQNFIERYDKVIYVDWCSNESSLLSDIKSNIKFKNNLTHIIVTKVDLFQINKELTLIPMIDVLGRNIGIRRADTEFIVSTNIDIIAEKPNIENLDIDTLYVAPRRDIFNYPSISPLELGNSLIKNMNIYRCMPDTDKSETPSHREDKWSIVVACGDYQLAHRNVWYNIKGFEEEMIYRGCADTNLMKKGLIYGKTSKLDLPVFHLYHSYVHPNTTDNAQFGNDEQKYIKNFTKTTNRETWGFSDYTFKTEIL